MTRHAGRLVAAIDLGGTRIKAGLVQGDAIVASRTTFLAPGDKTQEGILPRLQETLLDLCRDRGVDVRDVAIVGVGAAGAVDPARGVVVHSPNFPAWSQFRLRDLLADRVGLPVVLDNDANVITLGEATHGAGAGCRDFACVTLGSGIGGALFLDGRLYRGTFGMAGEFGHTTIVPEGRPCKCGNRGCLEQYASAHGLRHAVRRDRLFGDRTDEALADPDLPRRLYEAAVAGDARFQACFEDFGYHLAIGIGALLQILNVPLVVLAGGLARAFPAFGPRLLSELPARGYRCVNESARVVPCSLWEDGGILGAAALANWESD